MKIQRTFSVDFFLQSSMVLLAIFLSYFLLTHRERDDISTCPGYNRNCQRVLDPNIFFVHSTNKFQTVRCPGRRHSLFISFVYTNIIRIYLLRLRRDYNRNSLSWARSQNGCFVSVSDGSRYFSFCSSVAEIAPESISPFRFVHHR